MPICPTCLTKYPDEVGTCAADGTELVPDETLAHVDRDIEPGTVVGEYTVESKLGEGGFGAVYRAVHPLIGKTAAVKVLSRQFSSNPQYVSRFIAEARAVNQIRHRNIIDIFSFGQLPDGRQYYIMELLEGSTLNDHLRTRKRLTLDEAMPILRGVARALDAAHAKGIVHRDLKPENVFLVFDEDGRVQPKLLDFGLVKLLAATDTSSHHKTKTGTPMGTPYYMSPEQCRGLDDLDGRADVYSFGALVFELLSGSVPFTGLSTLDVLIQHMTSPPPRVSERCAEVPAAIDGPLAQIMAKEPSARPASVGGALDFLARAAGIEEPVSHRVVPSLSSAPTTTTLSAAERAIAKTVVADARSIPPPSGGARRVTPTEAAEAPPSKTGPEAPTPIAQPPAPAPARSPGSQTFLGAETDIAPPRKRRPALIVAIAALAVGIAVVVALRLGRGPGTAPHTTGAPPRIASATPRVTGSTSASSPRPDEDVELRIEGVPEGTIITSNGVELGAAPGPFTLRRGATAKLVFVAKGYKPKELTVSPDENLLLAIELERAPTPTLPATAVRRPPAASSTIHEDLEGFDKK